MHRRVFLAAGLAALASPGLSAVVGNSSQFISSGDPGFDAWRDSFYRRMVGLGMSEELLEQELAGITRDPRVSTLDNRQPELSRPISDYLRGVVSPARIQSGAQRLRSLPYLTAMESQYGVDPEVVLAIWAAESSFGQIQGEMDIIRSLATLAADGRRRVWAESELEAALRIIEEDQQTREKLVGSWAGAMGQTQFLPSVYRSRAVDGDGDGRRDIWGSAQDALYSAANYLRRAGWAPGGDWAREVKLPENFDYSLAEVDRKTPVEWALLGVTRADGQAWPLLDGAARAAILVPAGAGGPAFMAFPNHFTIRAYNNSTAYALAIGLLADGFAGRPALVAAWPQETPLSLSDRTAAQASLAKLGFDPGGIDGVIGAGTRTALRAWQKARSIPADAYLTPALVERLKAEAAAVVTPN